MVILETICKNTHNNTRSKLLLSLFSVEGRFVASVWVHERRHTGQTMEDTHKDYVVCLAKQHQQVQHYWCGRKRLLHGKCNAVDEIFQNCCIGRGSEQSLAPLPWPVISPDLTTSGAMGYCERRYEKTPIRKQ